MRLIEKWQHAQILLAHFQGLVWGNLAAPQIWLPVPDQGTAFACLQGVWQSSGGFFENLALTFPFGGNLPKCSTATFKFLWQEPAVFEYFGFSSVGKREIRFLNLENFVQIGRLWSCWGFFEMTQPQSGNSSQPTFRSWCKEIGQHRRDKEPGLGYLQGVYFVSGTFSQAAGTHGASRSKKTDFVIFRKLKKNLKIIFLAILGLPVDLRTKMVLCL